MSKDHAYAYEAGYRDGSINYELEHCPACKNVADLQEALAENAKLREREGNLFNAIFAKNNELIDVLCENEKLRELVRDFDKCLDTALYLADSAGYPTMPDQKLFASLRQRMRELGVKAD